MNWPVFLAFLAELLEFVVPLKSVHPIVEDLLSVLGTTCSSWYLLALPRPGQVSWGMSGILRNAVGEEDDLGSVFLVIDITGFTLQMCKVMHLVGVSFSPSTYFY